jgi:hypothetical protein
LVSARAAEPTGRCLDRTTPVSLRDRSAAWQKTGWKSYMASKPYGAEKFVKNGRCTPAAFERPMSLTARIVGAVIILNCLVLLAIVRLLFAPSQRY